MKSSSQIAEALTKILQTDQGPACLEAILGTRIPVSAEFLQLPEPWVVGHNGHHHTLGPLGLVNGVLEMCGYGKIAALYDDAGRLIGFAPVLEDGAA